MERKEMEAAGRGEEYPNVVVSEVVESRKIAAAVCSTTGFLTVF